ncbi:DNA polymerase IV [Fredinandcohnia quinoae]|uniref:DNA polymerase IV n=1 Tax=Fredinandcohnia quinoae TaxID=2918902 RepID=A0AAW5E9F4_9BACI|nr:DNA polymerase IV [Fredinandcohnia sp. SECRCQ15]MCH1626661.1 DNA polymerase IV [Fredinandcohnia sp. SECRCQ15]
MKEMYPKNGRVILHVDMNSFFASVEIAYDPSLQGKPVAIAGNVEERRGIIITCSYEARAFGVKTTMPLWEAKRKCPNLIVRKPNFERYRKTSLAMFELLRTYTNLVEPVSIDEGYMDITDCYEKGTPLEIAHSIQESLVKTLLLPSSIGIAPNKFLAKMASDMKKPMGITILRKRDVKKILWPLPVEEMHGVGKKTAEKLATIQIKTIGDLAGGNDIQVKQLLGINGERLKQRANGVDNRHVDPDAIAGFKSIGNSTTLPYDSTDEEELKTVLKKLSQSVGARVRRKDMLAANIQIIIRYDDRRTITRSRKLENPIEQDDEIYNAAFRLWKKHWNGDPIRLLGVTAQELIEKGEAFKQLDIFSYEKDAKREPLLKALDELKGKYGDDIVLQGIKNKKQPFGDNEHGTSFEKDFLSDLNND